MNSIGKYYIYTAFTQLRFVRIINIIFIIQFLRFDLVQFAFLQSIFLLSQFASELPTGILSDIFRRKTIIFSGLLLLFLSPLVIISTLNFSSSVNFSLLIISFVLEGIGNALLSGSDDALFYEAIRFEGKEELYGKIRGRVQLISAISIGVATFFGGVLYSFNKIFPYIFQSIMLLFSVIVLLTIKDAHFAKGHIEDMSGKQTLKSILSVFKEMIHSSNIWFMFLFTTIVVAVVNAIFSLLPNYVSNIGFSSSQNGAIFMVYSFVGGLVATQAYKLVKLNYKKLTILISLILLLGNVFQIQPNKYLFLLGICFLYIVVDILDPIVMQMLNLWVKDESRATFISGLSFCISLVTMIINPVIGFTVMKFGTINMLIFSSVGTVVMVTISYLLIMRTKNERK